ncbi:MAG: cbb3-type cytochrome oxidase assembly protein CcoS [Myxococcales bacterium]|nr:cbb3-type cytochrome oxidase assembly protein CcoS [Myxococcales bacterium]
MSGVLLLIPLSVGLGATFAWLFLRAARQGQFDDLDDEGRRIFDED